MTAIHLTRSRSGAVRGDGTEGISYASTTHEASLRPVRGRCHAGRWSRTQRSEHCLGDDVRPPHQLGQQGQRRQRWRLRRRPRRTRR
ncbi:hypothetical protein SGPA1_30253 [Streptomyces misionensis JCM 4497]